MIAIDTALVSKVLGRSIGFMGASLSFTSMSLQLLSLLLPWWTCRIYFTFFRFGGGEREEISGTLSGVIRANRFARFARIG